METIRILSQYICADDNEKHDILRAFVCILACDVKPADARYNAAKQLLQTSNAFLHAVYHTFVAKIPENVIQDYCNVLGAIDIDYLHRRCLYLRLVDYARAECTGARGAGAAEAIQKTLIRGGITMDGVDLYELFGLFKLECLLCVDAGAAAAVSEHLLELTKYAKVREYRQFLASKQYGLIAFLLSGQIEYAYNDNAFYSVCVEFLQKLITVEKSHEYLSAVLDCFATNARAQHTRTICCAIICSFLAKKNNEYFDMLCDAEFYGRVATIIRNGEFRNNNSAEGWCVYILLLSVANIHSTTSDNAVFAQTYDTNINIHNIVPEMGRVYGVSTALPIVQLMSMMVILFICGVHHAPVPVKIYTQLVDILENIVLQRDGRGYRQRTFPMDVILGCIRRVVLIDEINYSIIGSRLLAILCKIIVRYTDMESAADGAADVVYEEITRENIRAVLCILEYVVPYCLSYDFADYKSIVELKNIKTALGELRERAIFVGAGAEAATIDYILSTYDDAAHFGSAVCLPAFLYENECDTPNGTHGMRGVRLRSSCDGGSDFESVDVDVVEVPMALPVIVPYIVYL